VAEIKPEWNVSQYGMVAAIYDALMANVPHSTWLSRMERGVRERGKSPQSVLDCACGTGIVTELLWKRGYRPVCGFDISPAMVTIARAKAERFKPEETPDYFVQNASTLDLDGRTFDWIVSLFDSLNYILEPTELQKAFERLYLHTNPGGVLSFDMNSIYALSSDLFSQSQRFGPVQHHWIAHWDAETRICRVEMDFWIDELDSPKQRHFHETHIQRAYSVPEIRKMLVRAGYINIAVFGNYGERAPSSRSDRLLFFAEKQV
jgi:ubiquinone/menaquinone biosynthesis C-methylase UbiE